MGTDQGKTSNINGLAIMADLRGDPITAVGTTTFRPPYTPVTLGLFAGRETGKRFAPTRLTPMHEWHIAQGATLATTGQWLRPKLYQHAGESYAQAWQRECRHVRAEAGLVDVSTLGKIDVKGPDAGEFLDRVYANNLASLAVGRARYGLMLREDGLVMDDGTVARLADHHYFLTTTTANAGAVMSHLEFLLATAWPDLRARVTSVSDHFAQIALAGPSSRAVLQALLPQTDITNDALPHMGVLRTILDGVALNIFRVSYSGERAYELSIAAGYGLALWQRLLEVGAPYRLAPYGTEAMGALRIEKGHVAGPELDGRVTAADLGMSKLSSKKRAFIGQRLLERPGLQAANRPGLVGLLPVGVDTPISAGAVLTESA
ncbi:MAG: (2Fe-2S)-binding protein, partial [Burkholderiales bacterium 21-58-4]